MRVPLGERVVMTEAAMNRLEEIEARAKAARHDEWRWDSLLGALELGDAGRMHISVPGRPRDPPSIFALLSHKDVVWLVAQVRERDAEIARLRAENARLRVAVSGLVPHVYTGLASESDRIRREAVALLRGEAPDA